ncbi:MAG: T9SS type A sorting domain-containing protein [Crocinitomicaceae bacterium]|nr:T9SS type A sorting domain-containing protein [Crocinitomicaceae bacterium]
MLKIKYHIIVIALLLSGAMSFSQERFNSALDIPQIDIGYYIKETLTGFEVAGIKPGSNDFNSFLYKLDIQGNFISIDTIHSYGEINGGPYKFKSGYAVSGQKDSISGIGYKKPFFSIINEVLDTTWTYHALDFIYEGYFVNPIYLGGNELVVGGTYYVNPSQQDMFLSKFDTLGNLIWENKHVIGSFGTRTTSIDKVSDGGFILSGATTSFGNGIGTTIDIYIRKVDSLGDFQWHKYWGSALNEQGKCIVAQDSIIIVYGGTRENGSDYDNFVTVLDINGNVLWDTIFSLNSSLDEEVNAVVRTQDGSIVCAISYVDDVSGVPHGALVKFLPSGQLAWKRTYSIRIYDQYFRDLIQTSDGGYAMTGFVFPDGSGNTQDVWVVKVDSMGCDVPLCYLGERELGLELPILKCYPNPTSSISTIELLENSREIQLYNSAGILQKKIEIENNQKELKLDLSLFPHDIYILRLLDKNGVTIGQGKVVKQ